MIDDRMVPTFSSAELHLIKKENWDFAECENFQNECVQKVQLEKNSIYLIFTNHPPCFTLGKGKLSSDLKEMISNGHLDYPVHHIHRGGGLTFHHPHQLIIYPIFNMHYWKMQLKDIFEIIGQTVAKILNENQNKSHFTFEWNPLGVWSEQKKIASMGIGLKKGVSIHGLALNIKNHPILGSLGSLAPCGLSVKTYFSLHELGHEHFNFDYLVELFTFKFQHEFQCPKF
jgi:lipoyl(octanoyl) transferase